MLLLPPRSEAKAWLVVQEQVGLSPKWRQQTLYGLNLLTATPSVTKFQAAKFKQSPRAALPLLCAYPSFLDRPQNI